MFSFKIEKCPQSGVLHDWGACPFLHPGEKARRRDPRVHAYGSSPCPEYRKGTCRRGDGCPFAHGVFESWLHPSRYRTQLCKEGAACRRAVCFFAHTLAELREPPAAGPTLPPIRTCCDAGSSAGGHPHSPGSTLLHAALAGRSTDTSRCASPGVAEGALLRALSYESAHSTPGCSGGSTPSAPGPLNLDLALALPRRQAEAQAQAAALHALQRHRHAAAAAAAGAPLGGTVFGFPVFNGLGMGVPQAWGWAAPLAAAAHAALSHGAATAPTPPCPPPNGAADPPAAAEAAAEAAAVQQMLAGLDL